MLPSNTSPGRRPTLTNLEDLLPSASTSAAAGERRTEVKREARSRVKIAPVQNRVKRLAPGRWHTVAAGVDLHHRTVRAVA